VALAALPYWTSTLHWPTIDENFRFMSGFLGGWRNKRACSRSPLGRQ